MLNLETLPEKTGVYLMKNQWNEIIYIGKAKNLKKRVSSYFAQDHLSIKTHFLVEKIAKIDHIVTNTEKEALILENQLIKKYLPHYNINLKDGKSYLQLAIDYNHHFPRIYTTREKPRNKVRYFGPYPSAIHAKDLSLIAEKYFFLRRCKVVITQTEEVPSHRKACSLFFLKKCYGACVLKETEKVYQKRVKQFILFLNGHFNKIEKQLKEDIHHYSSLLKYELAAKTRDLLLSLEEIVKEQKIYFDSQQIIDVWGYYESQNHHTFVVLKFIKGQLTHKHVFNTTSSNDINFIFQNVLEKIYVNEVIQKATLNQDLAFIENSLFHLNKDESSLSVFPDCIILPPIFLSEENKIQELFQEFYQSSILFESQIKITIPFASLKKMALDNAEAEWRTSYKISQTEYGLLELKKILNLSKDIVRIETYDISNIGDHFATGACVSFYNGLPDKKNYRHFKIKYIKKQNDFAMLQEILLRRFQLKNMPQPDLIVIDGGKGQVSAAQELLEAMKIDIPFIGLAKKEELIVFPFDKPSLQLDIKHPGLKILMHSRDEAHRFANQLRAKMLSKKTVTSQIDQIAGLSKNRKKQLLIHFENYENLKGESIEKIYTLTKIPHSTIKKILDFLNQTERDV